MAYIIYPLLIVDVNSYILDQISEVILLFFISLRLNWILLIFDVVASGEEFLLRLGKDMFNVLKGTLHYVNLEWRAVEFFLHFEFEAFVHVLNEIICDSVTCVVSGYFKVEKL